MLELVYNLLAEEDDVLGKCRGMVLIYIDWKQLKRLGG
jgi:hypothetical protein